MKKVQVTICISEKSGGPKTISGWGFEVDGLPLAVTRYIRPNGEPSPDTWVTTEPITGQRIPNTHAQTRAQSMEVAARVVREHGVATIQEMIEHRKDARHL